MQRQLISAIATAVALCIFASFCPAKQPAAKLKPETVDLAKGNNRFALDLYSRLDQGSGNLFFSPYSISNALAMTYAGARGQTATDMAATLKFPVSGDPVHGAFADLIRELNRPGLKRKYELAIANRLWGQKNYGFSPDFLTLTKDVYGAGLEELDFARATEQARKTINDWVEQQTQGRIKDLLPDGSLPPDTRLVLTNAIYFKGQWAEAFNPKATTKQDFKLGGGKTIKVDMMQNKEAYGLYEDDSMQMLDLPYEQNELSMLVLLPRKDDDLAKLEKNITADNLQQWLAKMKRSRVALQLPRFKFTSTFKLKPVLSQMGMAIAFTKGKADFSGMATGEQLGIDEVIHKAFVAVDEKGTEAAAATAVTIRPTSVPAGPEVTFRADHPFSFVIRDNRTGSILFMGRLVDPGK